jgi:hypothetical protein
VAMQSSSFITWNDAGVAGRFRRKINVFSL